MECASTEPACSFVEQNCYFQRWLYTSGAIITMVFMIASGEDTIIFIQNFCLCGWSITCVQTYLFFGFIGFIFLLLDCVVCNYHYGFHLVLYSRVSYCFGRHPEAWSQRRMMTSPKGIFKMNRLWLPKLICFHCHLFNFLMQYPHNRHPRQVKNKL